ncbi:hypothetical protein BLNAU_11560 [Blattamonas nauphoetae]|uniref:Uncharacterized protein n=1 Tax=Blattamonas nauphoetae TaxID=2049346 RepID=A0ABQ9XRL5_9EUKA|nr:hypothetical protein BLNAU_11560 [Blattamonas nauphoetae]
MNLKKTDDRQEIGFLKDKVKILSKDRVVGMKMQTKSNVTASELEERFSTQQRQRLAQQKRVSDRIDSINKAALVGDFARAEKALMNQAPLPNPDDIVQKRLESVHNYRKAVEGVNSRVKKALAETESHLSKPLTAYIPELRFTRQDKQDEDNDDALNSREPSQSGQVRFRTGNLNENELIEGTRMNVSVLMDSLMDPERVSTLQELSDWISQRERTYGIDLKRLTMMDNVTSQSLYDAAERADTVEGILMQAEEGKDSTWEKWNQLYSALEREREEEARKKKEEEAHMSELLSRSYSSASRVSNAKMEQEIVEEEMDVKQLLMDAVSSTQKGSGSSNDEAKRLRALLSNLETTMNRMKSKMQSKEKENERSRDLLISKIAMLEEELNNQKKAKETVSSVLEQSQQHVYEQQAQVVRELKMKDKTISQLQNQLAQMKRRVYEVEREKKDLTNKVAAAPNFLLSPITLTTPTTAGSSALPATATFTPSSADNLPLTPTSSSSQTSHTTATSMTSGNASATMQRSMSTLGLATHGQASSDQTTPKQPGIKKNSSFASLSIQPPQHSPATPNILSQPNPSATSKKAELSPFSTGSGHGSSSQGTGLPQTPNSAQPIKRQPTPPRLVPPQSPSESAIKSRADKKGKKHSSKIKTEKIAKKKSKKRKIVDSDDSEEPVDRTTMNVSWLNALGADDEDETTREDDGDDGDGNDKDEDDSKPPQAGKTLFELMNDEDEDNEDEDEEKEDLKTMSIADRWRARREKLESWKEQLEGKKQKWGAIPPPQKEEKPEAAQSKSKARKQSGKSKSRRRPTITVPDSTGTAKPSVSTPTRRRYEGVGGAQTPHPRMVRFPSSSSLRPREDAPNQNRSRLNAHDSRGSTGAPMTAVLPRTGSDDLFPVVPYSPSESVATSYGHQTTRSTESQKWPMPPVMSPSRALSTPNIIMRSTSQAQFDQNTPQMDYEDEQEEELSEEDINDVPLSQREDFEEAKKMAQLMTYSGQKLESFFSPQTPIAQVQTPSSHLRHEHSFSELTPPSAARGQEFPAQPIVLNREDFAEPDVRQKIYDTLVFLKCLPKNDKIYRSKSERRMGAIPRQADGTFKQVFASALSWTEMRETKMEVRRKWKNRPHSAEGGKATLLQNIFIKSKRSPLKLEKKGPKTRSKTTNQKHLITQLKKQWKKEDIMIGKQQKKMEREKGRVVMGHLSSGPQNKNLFGGHGVDAGGLNSLVVSGNAAFKKGDKNNQTKATSQTTKQQSQPQATAPVAQPFDQQDQFIWFSIANDMQAKAWWTGAAIKPKQQLPPQPPRSPSPDSDEVSIQFSPPPVPILEKPPPSALSTPHTISRPISAVITPEVIEPESSVDLIGQMASDLLTQTLEYQQNATRTKRHLLQLYQKIADRTNRLKTNTADGAKRTKNQAKSNVPNRFGHDITYPSSTQPVLNTLASTTIKQLNVLKELMSHLESNVEWLSNASMNELTESYQSGSLEQAKTESETLIGNYLDDMNTKQQAMEEQLKQLDKFAENEWMKSHPALTLDGAKIRRQRGNSLFDSQMSDQEKRMFLTDPSDIMSGGLLTAHSIHKKPEKPVATRKFVTEDEKEGVIISSAGQETRTLMEIVQEESDEEEEEEEDNNDFPFFDTSLLSPLPTFNLVDLSRMPTPRDEDGSPIHTSPKRIRPKALPKQNLRMSHVFEDPDVREMTVSQNRVSTAPELHRSTISPSRRSAPQTDLDFGDEADPIQQWTKNTIRGVEKSFRRETAGQHTRVKPRTSSPHAKRGQSDEIWVNRPKDEQWLDDAFSQIKALASGIIRRKQEMEQMQVDYANMQQSHQQAQILLSERTSRDPLDSPNKTLFENSDPFIIEDTHPQEPVEPAMPLLSPLGSSSPYGKDGKLHFQVISPNPRANQEDPFPTPDSEEEREAYVEIPRPVTIHGLKRPVITSHSTYRGDRTIQSRPATGEWKRVQIPQTELNKLEKGTHGLKKYEKKTVKRYEEQLKEVLESDILPRFKPPIKSISPPREAPKFAPDISTLRVAASPINFRARSSISSTRFHSPSPPARVVRQHSPVDTPLNSERKAFLRQTTDVATLASSSHFANSFKPVKPDARLRTSTAMVPKRAAPHFTRASTAHPDVGSLTGVFNTPPRKERTDGAPTMGSFAQALAKSNKILEKNKQRPSSPPIFSDSVHPRRPTSNWTAQKKQIQINQKTNMLVRLGSAGKL